MTKSFENIEGRKFLTTPALTPDDTRTASAWIAEDPLSTGKTLVIRLPTLSHAIAVREGRHLLWLIERSEFIKRRVVNLEKYLAEECEVDLALVP